MIRFSLGLVGASLLLAALAPLAFALEPVVLTASSDVSLDPSIEAEEAYFSNSRAHLGSGVVSPADPGLQQGQPRAPRGYSVLDLSF